MNHQETEVANTTPDSTMGPAAWKCVSTECIPCSTQWNLAQHMNTCKRARTIFEHRYKKEGHVGEAVSREDADGEDAVSDNDSGINRRSEEEEEDTLMIDRFYLLACLVSATATQP